MGDTSKEDGLFVDGLPQKSTGGDDGTQVKAGIPSLGFRCKVVPCLVKLDQCRLCDQSKLDSSTLLELCDRVVLCDR